MLWGPPSWSSSGLHWADKALFFPRCTFSSSETAMGEVQLFSVLENIWGEKQQSFVLMHCILKLPILGLKKEAFPCCTWGRCDAVHVVWLWYFGFIAGNFNFSSSYHFVCSGFTRFKLALNGLNAENQYLFSAQFSNNCISQIFIWDRKISLLFRIFQLDF